ncbi:hypothetical protein GPICK_12660 [Geobacter pickeringii]|uniref:Histidine kinase domain-containing protein n=1 Tax=Geobacter pickeringii TaxID=345632 RepID=A0A0B5BDY2_9BACT|nr:hypothetical protein GPICK_12660 [Geobacter pickeringii]
MGSKRGKSRVRTHFASPERATAAELTDEIESVSHTPLVDGLMYVANGLFAVLNEHRQILALNESFLKLMGIEDPSTILGLRPGEYLHCIHACEMPDGCGTSPSCATCGAVISIVTALATEHPQEGTCSITVEKDNTEVDLFFQVRCCPIRIKEKKFVLIFLHDISVHQQRANLERAFFHDINNLMTGLLGKSDIFQMKGVWDAERFADIQKLIQRTVQEFSMQQALFHSMSHTYQPLYCTVSVNSLLDALAETFEGHPSASTVTLDIAKTDEQLTLLTDPAIVDRILVNMVTNAIEATDPGGAVRVFVERGDNSVSLSVWNRKPIPHDHALRIFKRNFTTKRGLGHGLGTYSMKFFGEKVLGGSVDFTTSDKDGTVFRLTLTQS